MSRYIKTIRHPPTDSEFDLRLDVKDWSFVAVVGDIKFRAREAKRVIADVEDYLLDRAVATWHAYICVEFWTYGRATVKRFYYAEPSSIAVMRPWDGGPITTTRRIRSKDGWVTTNRVYIPYTEAAWQWLDSEIFAVNSRKAAVWEQAVQWAEGTREMGE